jgi:hypothetical protein
MPRDTEEMRKAYERAFNGIIPQGHDNHIEAMEYQARQSESFKGQMMAVATGPINTGPAFVLKKRDGSDFGPGDAMYGPALLVKHDKNTQVGRVISKGKDFVRVALNYGEIFNTERERYVQQPSEKLAFKDFFPDPGKIRVLLGTDPGIETDRYRPFLNARQYLQNETDDWLRGVLDPPGG